LTYDYFFYDYFSFKVVIFIKRFFFVNDVFVNDVIDIFHILRYTNSKKYTIKTRWKEE